MTTPLPIGRILITGAGGFIGRWLTAALLADRKLGDARIVLVDRELSRQPGQNVDMIQGDLANSATLQAVLSNEGGAAAQLLQDERDTSVASHWMLRMRRMRTGWTGSVSSERLASNSIECRGRSV